MACFLLLLLWLRFINCKITSMYIFGDSLVDNGNNNYLLGTYAKANFYPYGRDFPGGPNPTGRFSNGYLVPDFLASYLGVSFAEPYLSPSGSIQGSVNFGAAGCGVYNSTGHIFVLFQSSHYPRPMQLQVQNFIAVKEKLIQEIGETATLRRIQDALFYITFGSNDIANNYYLERSILQNEFTISDFINVLIEIYEKQIEVLYTEGARKFVVASLFPLGCSPLYLIESNLTIPGECQNEINLAARIFNSRLEFTLCRLRCRLQNAHILYADSYHVPLYIIQHPGSYDFKVLNVGCCNYVGPGPNDNRVERMCLPFSRSCPNAAEYVFWDQVHPTSKAYSILANHFWDGPLESIRPMNVKQLDAL